MFTKPNYRITLVSDSAVVYLLSVLKSKKLCLALRLKLNLMKTSQASKTSQVFKNQNHLIRTMKLQTKNVMAIILIFGSGINAVAQNKKNAIYQPKTITYNNGLIDNKKAIEFVQKLLDLSRKNDSEGWKNVVASRLLNSYSGYYKKHFDGWSKQLLREMGNADLNTLGINIKIQDKRLAEGRIEIEKLDLAFSICIENGEIKINEN